MSSDSVVKESLTTQTAEEAARELIVAMMLEDGLTLRILEEEKLVTWFLKGVQWAQEREKVIGERWVMISELDGLPIGFLYREKQEMQGYRAVKVRLVEI